MKITTKLGLVFSSMLLELGGLGLMYPKFPVGAANDITSALNGTASPGQENGAETSGITNGLSGNGSLAASGQSNVGVGYGNGNLVLNSVPNLDFGNDNKLFSADYFYLRNLGNGSVGNWSDSGGDTITGARALIWTNNDPNITTWHIDATASPLSKTKGPGVDSISSSGYSDIGFTLTSDNSDYDNGLGMDSDDAQGIYHGYFDPSNGKYYNQGKLVNPTINYGFATYDGQESIPTQSYRFTGSHLGTPFDYISKTLNNPNNPIPGGQSFAINFYGVKSAQLFIPVADQGIGTYIGTLTWALGTGAS